MRSQSVEHLNCAGAGEDANEELRSRPEERAEKNPPWP